MPDLLVLDEPTVRRLLDLDALAAALERALTALSNGEASVPARIAAVTGHGLLAAMPGYVPGFGLGAKLVSVFPENGAHGLPSHQAVIVAFSEDTGTPAALLDATYITGIRTAMTAAIAARALARPGSSVLAVLGAGVQGEHHVTAFDRLLGLREVRVASRDQARAQRLAARHPRARVAGSFEEAVRGADIVACCTDARDPVFADAWLAPGTHVSSVGTGHEVDAATIRRARVFVESPAAFQPPPAGTAELQGAASDSVTEIGNVLAGRAPGRTSRDGITVYKSMGHAVEDLAAVRVVLERARATGGLPTARL